MLDSSELTGRSDGRASARLDCYIGDNIKQARTHQNMSLVDLGQVLGVQGASMADYEAGRERLSSTMLYRIAVTLNVTLASLFGVNRL